MKILNKLQKYDSLLQNMSWFVFAVIITFALFNDGGINILSHLLLSASLIVFALIYAVRKKENVGNFDLESILLTWFILFFLISYFLSQTLNVGLFELILFVSSVFVYVLIVAQKWDLGLFHRFLWILLLVTFIVTLYGFFIYLSEPFNRFASTFGISIYKFVSYPNAFANYILAIIPIGVYFFFTQKKLVLRIIIGAIMVVLLSSLFLTYSRGALLVLGFIALLGLIIFYLMKIKGLWKKAGVVLLLLIIALGLTIPVNAIRSANEYDVYSVEERVSTDTAETTASTTNRLDFWKGSVKIFLANPIIGTGPASFRYFFPQYQKSLLGNADTPHNLFLKILSENGFFAFGLFAAFLITILLRLLKRFKSIDSSHKALLIALIVSVTGSLAHNMIDYNLNFVPTILILFIFLAIISVIVNETKKDHPKRKIKFTLIVAALIMLFMAGHEVYYSYVFKQARAHHKAGEYELAEEKYKDARSIYLKRDLYIVFAQMYEDLFYETDDLTYLYKAEEALMQGYHFNKKDAFLINYVGDIKSMQGITEKTLEYYQEAVLLDPKNNLDYHYDLLRIETSLNSEERGEAIFLLDSYRNELANNAHLTVLTGNADTAMMMYDVLISHTTRENDMRELKENRDLMWDTYMLEKQKFEQYYDLELKKED